MTLTPETHDSAYSVLDLEVRDANQRMTEGDLSVLLDRCQVVDQRSPLGDHALSAITSGQPNVGGFVVTDRSFRPVAYSQTTPSSENGSDWTIDIAIDPSHRHDHGTILDNTFDAVLTWLQARRGRTVRWWRHEPTETERLIAERHGLRPARQLLEMHRLLDAGQRPPALATRPFVVGIDEPALLEVNGLAFADHPEQGNWTIASLLGRFDSDWFDPAGLLVHTDEAGAMLGFCWTKIHRTPGAAPVGEIYVVAVRPSHHSRGIGRALTQAGLASLRERDIDRVMLFVEATNTTARAMYEQLGFHVAATTTAFDARLPTPTQHTQRMSTVRHQRRSAIRVQICDGCCCGTERKHPGVDHAGIRRRIAAATECAGGHVRVVGCVDECSRSNVVIVRPAGFDASRIWIGGVLDDHLVDALCTWLATGATAPVPTEVAAHIFTRVEQKATASNAAATPVELRSRS